MEKATSDNHRHYNNRLKKYASENRNGMNKPEACMWKYVLSNRRMKGYQFTRQRPVLNYIADFMCKPLNLVIEIDGSSHESAKAEAYDRKRNQDLEDVGITTLRFSNWEVMNRIDNVAVIISEWIEKNATVPPPLPRKRKSK